MKVLRSPSRQSRSDIELEASIPCWLTRYKMIFANSVVCILRPENGTAKDAGQMPNAKLSTF